MAFWLLSHQVHDQQKVLRRLRVPPLGLSRQHQPGAPSIEEAPLPHLLLWALELFTADRLDSLPSLSSPGPQSSLPRPALLLSLARHTANQPLGGL